MQSRPFLGPLRTHYRLGGATIGPDSAVEVAAARLGEISTCGDDFDHDLFVVLPLSLAQVRGLAVANQGLEHRLPGGAADVELNIPAAGGPALVVRGAARRSRAWVGILGDGKRPSCRGHWSEAPALEPATFDDGKPVGAEASSRRGMGCRAAATLVTMCRAPARATVVTGGEKAARDVDARVAPELALALEDGPELDALGVSEEPGRIVILIGVDGGDANRDVEGAAMPAETAARWRRQ